MKLFTRSIFVFLLTSLVLPKISNAQVNLTRTTFNSAYNAISLPSANEITTPIPPALGNSNQFTNTIGFANNDDGVAYLPLPFNFDFNGTVYNATTSYLGVSTNGYLYFSNDSSNASKLSEANNVNLFLSAAPNSVLAPWFDNLHRGPSGWTFGSASGKVLHQVNGTSPNREWIIQYTDWASYQNTSGGQPRQLNFQVALFETSGVIEFRYGSKNGSAFNAAESASIGIENASGGNGNYIDGIVGSSMVNSTMLTSGKFPSYHLRYTPGVPSAISSGVYEVGVGKTYNSLTEAIADANHRGVGGNVTFSLTDAVYDSLSANGSNIFPLIIGPITGTASGSVLTVSGIASKSTLNYAGSSNGTIGNKDNSNAISGITTEPIVAVLGSDYIILQNLQLNSTSSLVEHGLLVVNASSTDGANNNVFKNIGVNLARANISSIAIRQINASVASSQAGANSNNKYYNLAVEDVYSGVSLNGSASFFDDACEIGVDTCSTFNTIGGTSANDIGNGSADAFGIRAINQSNVKVFNNIVRNVTSTGSTSLSDGIYINNNGSSTLSNGLVEVYRNKISNISRTGTGLGYASGIKASNTGNVSSELRIYNNWVSSIQSSGSTTSTRSIIGILIQESGGGNASLVQVDFNSVSIAPSNLNCSNTCFEIGTVSGPIIKVRDNIFSNQSGGQVGSAKHYCWVTPSTSSIGPVGSISNYNDLFISNIANGYVGLGGTVDYQDLFADWKLVSASHDPNSITANPSFTNINTDLHSSQPLLNGTGNYSGITWVTTDIDCESRLTPPDIGADEFLTCFGVFAGAAVSNPASICNGSTSTITLTGYSQEPGINIQWQKSTTSPLTGYSNIGGATSPIYNTPALTLKTYYRAIVSCSFSSQSGISDEDSVEVFAPPTSSISASGSTNICNGSTVQLTASSNAVQPAYQWKLNGSNISGATSVSYNASAAGAYTCVVTDSIDVPYCSTTSNSISVTIQSGPSLSSSVSNASCNGGNDGAVNLTASGSSPFVYAWNNGATTEDINNVSAGSYTVSVTDNNGCTASLVSVVNEATTLSASCTMDSAATCGLSDGQASVVASGGTAPYTYLWSNGATSTVASSLAPSTYTVTVTDNNGCTATCDVTITETGTLSLTCTVLSNVSCNGGNNGIASVSVGGGVAPYSYLWSNGNSSFVALNLTAGVYTVTVTDANGCVASCQATITEPQALSVSCSIVSTIDCAGDNTGEISAAISGGTAPYMYQWNNAATTSSISSLTAGTYMVTVTDANNCTASCSVTLTEPTALFLNASVIPNTCFGDTLGIIDITPGGGVAPYSYLWSSGETVEDLSQLAQGTYTVSVTDANACIISAAYTITTPSELIASCALLRNVDCNGGSDGSVSVNVSGGTSPYLYLWSNGVTTASNANIPAGTYTVTVTDDNGCEAICQLSVSEPPVLSSSAVITAVSCNGGSNGAIDLSVSGGVSPYTYKWSTTHNTQDISNLIAGTYSVTITDANACSIQPSFVVTEPIAISISANVTNATCGNSDGAIDITIANGVAPYSFAWSNGSTLEDQTMLSAGTYTVTVSDANACSATASFTVSQPSGFTLNGTTVPLTCYKSHDGGMFVQIIGGTSPFTYLWSDGRTNKNRPAVKAGVYTITVTDANGCTGTLSFNVTQPPKLLGTKIKTPVSCNGGNDGACTVNITGGTPPYTYQWNTVPVQTTNTASGLSKGVYVCITTDANGCTRKNTVFIPQPAILWISMTKTDVTTNGGSDGTCTATPAGGTAPYTYVWGNGATTSTITGLVAGTYTCTVTDSNGCTVSKSKNVNQPGARFSMNSSDPSFALDLYPNPNSGQFVLNIEGGEARSYQLMVSDLSGRTVYQTEGHHNGGILSQQIHLEGISDGMYLLHWNDGVHRELIRFVIQH